MKKATEKFIETFIIISLPVAIFVGCAGSNEKKVENKQSLHTTYASYKSPIAQDELENYSLVGQENITPIMTGTSDVVTEYDGMVGPRAPENVTVTINTIDTKADSSHSSKILVTTSPGTELSLMEDPLLEQEPMLLLTQNIYYFESEKCKVKSEDYVSIKQHADFLMDNPNLLLTISGYSDQRGPEEYNLKLSERRAHAIAKLLGQFGVADSQLLTTGYGEMSTDIEQTYLDDDRRVELQYSDRLIVSTR